MRSKCMVAYWLAFVGMMLVLAVSCGGGGEGAVSGECSDEVDNDSDGDVDCDDEGCVGDLDCVILDESDDDDDSAPDDDDSAPDDDDSAADDDDSAVGGR